MIIKKSKIGVMIAYIYIMLPFFIFSLTWLKKPIGYTIGIAMIFIMFILYKHAPELPIFKMKKEEIILIVLLIALWVYLSGIGGYTYQNIDQHYRNSIFKILVENKWPVQKIVEMSGKSIERGLVYYMGFWLPAAAGAKIFKFNLEAGYLFQLIWAFVGIIIVYYLISCVLNKATVWSLLLFMTFGGLDLLGYYVTGNSIANIADWIHLEQWTSFQYSSFTTQLFWVYNQAIPAWLIFLLLYLQENNKSMIYIWSLAMILSTLPFVGMIPFMFYFMIRNVKRLEKKGIKENLRTFIKSVMSLENVLMGGITGILSFLFLIGNMAVGETDTLGVVYETKFAIMQYIVTIIFEVGIYFLIIYKYQKKNPLFYIALVWLLICPWIKVGLAEDFCMRASIPAQIVLFLMVVDCLMKSYAQKNKKYLVVLMIFLSISSCTSINEVNRTVKNTLLGSYTREYIDEDTIMTGGNFSGDVSKSIFYRFFAE